MMTRYPTKKQTANTQMPDDDEFLTSDELADRLKIHRLTPIVWRREGRGPSYLNAPDARFIRYRWKTDVLPWLEGCGNTSDQLKTADHVLRSIRDAIVDSSRGALKASRGIHTVIQNMQGEAMKCFVALNGWQITRLPVGHGVGHGWLDHSDYLQNFRPRQRTPRVAAIVGQPYGPLTKYVDELDTYAKKHGLEWHTPPMPYASIWFPSRTLFIVMHRPSHQVRWLPEQEECREFAQANPPDRFLTEGALQ